MVAEEKLVVGHWIVPLSHTGYILTIRHKNDGYEVLLQWEGGKSAVFALKKHAAPSRRYDIVDDPTAAYYQLLTDGQLEIHDQTGLYMTLSRFAGNTHESAAIDAAIEAASAVAQAAVEEENCRKDASCWSERYRPEALPLCEKLVEQSARYDMQWTNSFIEPKFFPGARWSARKGEAAGRVDFVGDKAKFQNGFSAWQNVVYVCSFDTKLETVVDIKVEPGRLRD